MTTEFSCEVTFSSFLTQAQYHFLVLPKENICSLAKVTNDHLKLLKHMDKVGQELAESRSNSNFK
jgi:hypothetical protein